MANTINNFMVVPWAMRIFVIFVFSESMCSPDGAVDKRCGKSYESSDASVHNLDKHFDARMEYQVQFSRVSQGGVRGSCSLALLLFY